MKKLWSVLLCAGLVLGLWGCSDEPVKGAVTQPPGLTVACGEASIAALGGGYDWRYQLQNGETSNIIADAAHPLGESLDQPVLEAETGEATLTWDGPAPDLVQVVAWPASCQRGHRGPQHPPGAAGGHPSPAGRGVDLPGEGLLERPGGVGRHRGVRFYRQRAGGVPGAPGPDPGPGGGACGALHDVPVLGVRRGGHQPEFVRPLGVGGALGAGGGPRDPGVGGEPDEVTLQRWPQGVPDEEAQGEELSWEGSLTPEAGWVYVFYADWEVRNGWGGTGVYAFCAGE